MKARLAGIRQSSRNRFALRLPPFAIVLFTIVAFAASSFALTPTPPATPTATPGGFAIADLLGAYDLAVEAGDGETMIGEAQVSERSGGGISILGTVRHPSDMSERLIQLRGRLSVDGSIAVNGIYNPDGDIVSQADGTLTARRMGQNVQITGTVEFSGVRNGTLGLTMAKQSTTNGGGGGGGCVVVPTHRGFPYGSSTLFLIGSLIALARRRKRNSEIVVARVTFRCGSGTVLSKEQRSQGAGR